MLAIAIVVAAVAILSLSSFFPALKAYNKSAVVLTTTVLFFLLFAATRNAAGRLARSGPGAELCHGAMPGCGNPAVALK